MKSPTQPSSRIKRSGKSRYEIEPVRAAFRGRPCCKSPGFQVTELSRRGGHGEPPLQALVEFLVRLGCSLVAVLFGIVFFVRHGFRQVDHRQHYEYERLNKRDKQTEHDRKDRDQHWRKPVERSADLM